MQRSVRLLILSQLCFVLGMLGCILLKPSGLASNDGISYFGVYRLTILPYALGLLGAAFFAVRASDGLPNGDMAPVRLGIRVYAPLIVGIVITPYSAGWMMDYLHTACGSALFSLQLILSAWLVWRLHYVWWAMLLGGLELLAGILSLLYLLPTHGFLMQSQITFQLAFGALLILSVRELARSTQRAR